MYNITSTLSKMPLPDSVELSYNVPLVAVVIVLCVFLWIAAQFESKLIQIDGLDMNQPKEPLQEAEQPVAAAPPNEVQPSTPQAPQTFSRLNPIQSIERQQRKRSEFAAAKAAVDDAPSTPRIRQTFRCLNPVQSIERHRRMRSKMLMNMPHFAEPETNKFMVNSD